MTAGDVVRAIREQNMQVATGMIGAPPVRRQAEIFKSRCSTLGRLSDVEQFEDIILKADADGNIVRIKDIGTRRAGSQEPDVDVKFDGKPTVFLAIFQLPDANALETHDLIMDEDGRAVSKAFPRV